MRQATSNYFYDKIDNLLHMKDIEKLVIDRQVIDQVVMENWWASSSLSLTIL